MSKTLWIALACTLVAAASAPLRAQQPTPPAQPQPVQPAQPAQPAAADSAQPMPAAAGQQMAQHADMMEVQKNAVAAATQALVLAKASPLDRAAIATQATTARDNLQTILTHLEDAAAHATADQKGHIVAVRAHEQEALKHAEELLQAANNQASTATELGAHAKAVVDHANAANAAMAKEHGDKK